MAQQESQLNITEEELERFQKAMKNEEFRRMFTEYAKEISDPVNKKRYEEEIAQLEAERGMEVKFINPQDGFVIKTSIKSADGMKAFINICQSDVINKATSIDSKKKVDEKNVQGQEWSIPYSLNQPRDDLDKAGKKCKVYDIIFHTATYQMGQENPRFKQLIVDTTFDAIEGNWKVKLDRKNFKYPKMKFKGTKASTIIRTSNDKGIKDVGADIEFGDKKLPYPYKTKTPQWNEGRANPNDVTDSKEITSGIDCGFPSTNHSSTPKYSIVHRGHLDLQNFTNARDSRASTRPQELVVNIQLPLCETSAGVDLDIFERQLILDSSDPHYHLDITLPYPVNENEGRAQFVKSKRRLVVTLPVIPAPNIALNGYADDRIAENKVNALVTEMKNDDVDVAENDDTNLNADGVESNDTNLNADDVESNDTNLNSDKVESNAGDDDNSGSNQHNEDDISKSDIGDINDANNDNCNSVIDIENACKNSDTEAAGECQKNCNDVDQKHSASNISGVQCPVFKIPPYSFHQNNESVTFVVHVSKVSLDTVSLGFNGSKCSINFPSTSITSTNFLSPGYALHVQFPDECLIDSVRSSVDLNETNLVLVLYKMQKCHGMWAWCMIGSDEHTFEKKLFLTEETLNESLDEVKDHWAQQPGAVSCKVESISDEETVIEIKRDTSNDNSMGNVLATADEILFSEVKSSTDIVKDEIKTDTKTDCCAHTLSDDDAPPVKYADLEEVVVIEENYEDENEAGDLNEPQRLSTVQENEPTIELKDKMTMGVVEMQKARAIKCGKNRRRRRRSTGSHDQSSSVSEEEGDGSARRGKRRLRKSRSLSFGSSADSHDDVDGQRCVRFNPVPEVHVFSNRADKRKWKELRRQQSLNGNTEFDSAQPKTSTDKICKLKSSLKDTRSHNITSDDVNAVSNSEVAVSNSCEDTDKYIFIGDDDDHDDGDYHASNGDDAYNDDDVDKNDDNDDSFVKLEKPQLTNSLIFDLDD